jgi:protein phosphatase 1G
MAVLRIFNSLFLSLAQNKALKPEEQMISALPDIKKLQITADDEFMVLACDGIWNFMTSDEVVAFVKERLAKDSTQPMSKICEQVRFLFGNPIWRQK